MFELAQLSITTVVNTAQCEQLFSAVKIICLKNAENLLMNCMRL